jgi:hypothetical protein
MAYFITDTIAGSQNIADTSGVQKHPLGTIVHATDPTLGGGEFIYLLGVASTTVGSVVEYDTDGFTSGLATVALDVPTPFAVAMSANVALSVANDTGYGWYQIAGIATLVKDSGVSLAPGIIIGAAAGIAIQVVTGLGIQGAMVAAVASAMSATLSVKVTLNRPHGPPVTVGAA